MLEFLSAYRYWIWSLGGALTFWLITSLPSWRQISRKGSWRAERDYARWRVRNAIFALILLVPLLVATTAIAMQ
ncbi:MAG TPA: hypothetical protein VF707_20230 [Ardenticatenaceae bacterium]|jgi:hypothetical protein